MTENKMVYTHLDAVGMIQFEKEMAKSFSELEVGVMYESAKGTKVILHERVRHMLIFKHVAIEQTLKVDTQTADYRYYRLRKVKKVFDAPVQEELFSAVEIVTPEENQTEEVDTYTQAKEFVKTCRSVTFESYAEFVAQLGVSDAQAHLKELAFSRFVGTIRLADGLINYTEGEDCDKTI